MTRTAILLAWFAFFGAVSSAQAQKHLIVGCTATTDCASAMVARDQGIFSKHGLDVELTRISVNSNIPAALMSNSLQIGGPTATVFLQAVAGGLDLVAISGASVMNNHSNNEIAAVARKGANIHQAKDFVGKKVGVPGLGAFMDVLFRKWLIENGVNPSSVRFIEVPFPTMTEVLKSASVDAVLAPGPTLARIIASDVGSVVTRYADDIARGQPIVFYVATREWAEKNVSLVKEFRAAIAEASVLVNAGGETISRSISDFTKQSLEIVNMVPPTHSEVELTSKQLAWWIDVMNQQNMLDSKIDVDALTLKSK